MSDAAVKSPGAGGDAEENKLEHGEVDAEDGSYLTPSLPSPDSVWSSSKSCHSERNSILYGDFEMDAYKECPELTLGIIKPDGMKYVEEIERIIKEDGIDIVQTRLVHLSPEQTSNFYYEHYGQPYFPALVTSVSAAPIKVLVLRRKKAVDMWKKLCGPRNVAEARKKWPNTLRAMFGTPGEDHKNVCHASESPEKALEEIRFFFPHMTLDPNILDSIQMEDYLRDYVNPTLLEGLAQVCKNKPIDPVTWLAEWLLMNNPYKPKMTKSITLTPT